MDLKYGGYQRGLGSMVCKFFYKKTSGGAATLANKFAIKNDSISNKESAKELYKPVIRRKVSSHFVDNIWGEDLADMQLINKFIKGFKFLSCVIDIYSNYAWVIPLKDKKGITITNAFQNILNESNCRPNKKWVDKGSEFYNRSMKSFLKNNNMEMYSTHKEAKSVVAARFIRTLKNKIYKYMTSI